MDQAGKEILEKLLVMGSLGYIKIPHPDCELVSKEFMKWCSDIQNWIDENLENNGGDFDIQLDRKHDLWFKFDKKEDQDKFYTRWAK